MSTQLALFDDAPPVAAVMLPRELILASAGSGKTYRISSSIIALLARGARPDEVFASTFTRKAAAEILERVLARLAGAALERDAAKELAAATDIPDGTRDLWLDVLERTVRELHRLNVGTLDAFFMRTVRSFGHDLGLPAAWEIADEPTVARIRAEALNDVLRRTDAGVLVELVRAIARDRVRHSVHASLLRESEHLLALHDALDPAAFEPWAALGRAAAAGASAEPAARLALADRIAALEPPLTRGRTPVTSWVRSLARSADAVRRGAWQELIADGICAKVVAGEPTFDGRPIDAGTRAAFEQASALARAALMQRLAAESRALGRFVALYATSVERRRRAAGAFGFDDLSRLLGGVDPLGERPDLYYRLDMQTRHILLDEFQDTSLAQWEALQPLVDELLSGHAGERAAVIVADPKQSIYGWRGATPHIVEQIGAHYGLSESTLATSWRSSPVVLDTVNHVFDSLEHLPLWEGEPACQRVAAHWKRRFTEHVPARGSLPGYAVLHVGPADDGRGQRRPRLCRRAAELTARLHAESPGASIGVLTRTNATVARILFELKRIGVHASGEGGNALTDAAPVTALLALLRLADHPGDTVARYHVAQTPLGAVAGLTDWRDRHAARAVAHSVRTRLIEAGYGATLAALAADIAHACDPRERRRVAQLVELAFRYDAKATLRPGDFVRLVEAEKVEDPTGAAVRVMTVHQSKGLEFDAVVLPELDAPLVRPEAGRALAYRPSPVGRATAIFPYISRKLQPLLAGVPELAAAREQAHEAALRDALSGLYVALTRARYALHIVVQPDGEQPGAARTAARVVREALAPGRAAAEGDVLYEHGDADWYAALRRARGTDAAPAARGGATPAGMPGAPAGADRDEAGARVGGLLRRATKRARVLPRRSPSELEGGETVDLRHVLRLDAAASAERGTIAHAWFERIGWLEDGVPADAELRRVARRVAPAITDAEIDALIGRFRGWLDAPAIRAALSRAPDEGGAEVEREVPFLRREGDTMIEGFIDRLVLLRRGGRVTGARILDFKTDAVEAGDTATLAARAAYYRPQLDAYRRAVAAMYGLTLAEVSARLLLVNAGVVQ